MPLSEAERDALEMRLQEIDLALEAPAPQQPPGGPALDFERDEIEALRRERAEILEKLGMRDTRTGPDLRDVA